jgi:ribosomal protein S18 acetylase RimI-like enzyme
MADAAETLALAFADDPLMAWIFEDDAARAQQLRPWWTWIVENRAAHVELHESADPSGDASSAALWHGPDPAPDDRDPGAFARMLSELIGGATAMQKLAGLAVIPEAHPTERHWYLAAVGTRPSHQGQGSGARLLAPALERCDADGVPAYLESSNDRNIAFYERLGFVATGRIQIPDGPHLTPMWREPRG